MEVWTNRSRVAGGGCGVVIGEGRTGGGVD